MVGFIFLTALLNLTLGYSLAVYIRGQAGRSPREFLADLLETRPHVCPQATVTPPATPDLPADDKAVGTANVQPSPDAIGVHHDATDTTKSNGSILAKSDVERRLAELTSSTDSLDNPASVILFELDGTYDNSLASEDRLLVGIANAVRDLLAESQTADRFGDRQLMLLLPGDDAPTATQLAELARQRVESMEFMVGEQPVRATISCALTQLSPNHDVEDVLATLNDTLTEARKMGGNRTYYYDGMSPSPVVPPGLDLAPQTCAV